MTFSLHLQSGHGGGAGAGTASAARKVSILYVEEAPVVAEAVRETLEAAGWRVEVCARGDEALRRLRGGAHFDLLIFSFVLPGLDGVELTKRVRDLPHLAHTPIIMLTATEVEREAMRAGVDAFLRKPQGVFQLKETVARLLARGSGLEKRKGRIASGSRTAP